MSGPDAPNALLLPDGWTSLPIEHLFAPLADGRKLHHGWSPQCDSEPAAKGEWGVLKTTAVQDGAYLSEHNKRLPSQLKPRMHFEVKQGDLLITCAGPRVRCGVPCLVRETRDRLILSGKMYRFRVRPEVIDSRYMEAYLRSPETQRLIDKMKTGISDSGLNLTHGRFFTLQVPVAPPAEQRRIVAKIEELFSDLDAGVAALERVRANLKRYRAAVLKAAVEGRLTEEWRTRHPATEPAAKLLERILAERRAKWEQDQLRKFKEAGKTPPKGWKEKYEEPGSPSTVPEIELPPTWTWAVADQLCGTITDGEHITPPRTESGVLLLSARNVVDGRLRFDEVDYISPETYATLCRRLHVMPGDVLMSCSGSVGRSCIAPEGLDFSLVRSVAVLKPVMPFGTFLSMAIRSILLQHQVSEKKSQTAQANIFQGKIKRLVFPLPPRAEQAEIVAEVDRRLSVADAAETQVEDALQRAARLRQAILKRAFEGKLVEQDRADEPAAALLDRIKVGDAACSNGLRTVVRQTDTSKAKATKPRSRARA